MPFPFDYQWALCHIELFEDFLEKHLKSDIIKSFNFKSCDYASLPETFQST